MMSTMAESLLSSNFDIIFTILSLLPTETLLRVQTVCRAWAQVISDPAFVRAHCSRPSPITALFSPRDRLTGNRYARQFFQRFQEGDEFPRSISGILSTGFKVVSCNHGILCFRRDTIFVVGNPATSSWSVVCYTPLRFSSYKYHGVALIYDPVISLNFKLALALIDFDHNKEGNYWIQFHIYCSETCSWTISSEFIQWWFPIDGQFYEAILESAQYEPCKNGGGSVCWTDSFGFLVGYEISTNTYWKTPPPLPFYDAMSAQIFSYDSIIYFTRIAYGVAKVWRLEGKDSWVLEGEASSEELRQFIPHSFAYDRARRALLIGDRRNEKLFALHLSSSRLEILSEFPAPLLDYTHEAHRNTLALLRGAKTGMDGLAREFRRMGLSVRWICTR